MYNEDRKNHYLDSIEANKIMIKNLFTNIEYIESYYGKDASDFTPEEIESLFIMLKSTSAAYLKICMGFLISYTEFCKLNKYKNPKSTNFYIMVSMLEKDYDKYIDKDLKDSRYILPTQLKNVMQSLVNPIDKVLIQLLWEGFGGEKLCEIRFLDISDIDFTNNLIKIRDINDNIIGEKYVTDSLLSYIKESESSDMRYHSNFSDDLRTSKRLDGNSTKIFKPLFSRKGSDTMSKAALYSRFKKIVEKLNMRYLSINSIGLAYPLYLGLLIKYINGNDLNTSFDNTSQMYRLMASLYYNKFYTSGANTKQKLHYNIRYMVIKNGDIHKETISAYIRNIEAIRARDIEITTFNFIEYSQDILDNLESLLRREYYDKFRDSKKCI